jgi:AcrR family transcriptional regulator
MVRRRQLNKEKVVARAVQLADDAGSAGDLTLTALAAALGVRTPSLYNHVAGQEGLRRDLAIYAVRALTSELRAAAAGRVGRDALLAMARAYRRFAHEHPGIYPFVTQAPDAGDEGLASLAEELLQLLLLVLASFGLAGDDALHAVRGFRSVLHGFVSLEKGEGYKMALDREESFDRLVAAYLDGLESRLSERGTITSGRRR